MKMHDTSLKKWRFSSLQPTGFCLINLIKLSFIHFVGFMIQLSAVKIRARISYLYSSINMWRKSRKQSGNWWYINIETNGLFVVKQWSWGIQQSHPNLKSQCSATKKIIFSGSVKWLHVLLINHSVSYLLVVI